MPRLLLATGLLLAAAPAMAEVELSFYGGWQGAPDGGVTVSGDALAPDADVSFEGDAEGGLSQRGVRATWWSESDFGLGLEVSHADLGGAADASGLRFADGIDILTVNGMRRWEDAFGGVTPYLGAGLGVATSTFEVGAEEVEARGPAVSWMAGASVPLSESWAVFGEYRGTYSEGEGDLDGGGTVETDAVTNSVNLGVSFSF